MKISIYTLKDPITNEIRYIGQTNDPKRRLNRHLTNSRSFKDKRHISNWIRSLLYDPIMDIIETCEYSERNIRENHWINYYKNQGFDLCNSSNGGAGAGINNKNCVGRKISEETKTKISLSNKDKKNTLGKCGLWGKTIYQYNKEKELIAIYNSIENAVKATGYNRITIRRNIQNISSSKKYIWTDKPLY